MRDKLYSTNLGEYFIGDAKSLLPNDLYEDLRGKIQLILTSPPFPLNNKKKYGNFEGGEYKEWFVSLAEVFSELLTEDGSIVIELGNAWEPERPVQSLLHLESLLGFVKHPRAGLFKNIDIILHNIEKLKCDMYDSSLIPVALVNKLVSLADHPSSVILEKFAKIGINK